MKVHELVSRCAQARESADPMKAMRELLEGLRTDVAAIEAMLRITPPPFAFMWGTAACMQLYMPLTLTA